MSIKLFLDEDEIKTDNRSFDRNNVGDGILLIKVPATGGGFPPTQVYRGADMLWAPGKVQIEVWNFIDGQGLSLLEWEGATDRYAFTSGVLAHAYRGQSWADFTEIGEFKPFPLERT